MSSVTDVHDYVIVGSGPGGATVAARLAESGADVLLLEAGSDPRDPAEGLPSDVEVPAFHPFASENPALAWSFFVHNYGDDRARRRPLDDPPPGVLYPRASTLGGCSAHNAMMLLATPDRDWDEIARLTGDASWRADKMRAHFQAVDRCEYRPLAKALALLTGGRLNPSGHGWRGWLTSELARPQEAWSDVKLIEAVRTALRADLFAEDPSWRRTVQRLARFLVGEADPNDGRSQGRKAEGFCETPLTTSRGRRVGARERAIEAERKFCLRIAFDALATRVIFENGRAVGVEYLQGAHLFRASPLHKGRRGAPRTALARRETILCGGAFNSPQLLMLSGVGPPEEVEKTGRPLVMSLRGVGANLQDRYEVSLVHKLKRPLRCLEGVRFEVGDPVYQRWKAAAGMYVSNGAALAFKLSSRPGLPEPDLFAMGLLTRFDGYYPGYSEVIREARADVSFALLKAYTTNRRGSVRLASGDPRDPPVIDFASFAEGADGPDGDIAALVEGMKQLRRTTARLVDRGLILPEDTPGANVNGDEALADFVRARAWGHHASCTCAIGRPEDGGVLDSAFRVHGVEGLRVVDASVFPRIPGYFIVSAIYTVAEKAAHAILSDSTRARCDSL